MNKAPNLRFKEFSGEWKKFNFKKIFKEVKDKTSNTDKYKLYSLTIESGVVPKSERYEREFLISKEEENYKIVHSNEYVYNPMNLRFGALARYRGKQAVSVSGYYNVFEIIDNQAYVFWDNFLKTNRMMYIYNTIATGSLIEKRRVHFSQFIELSLPIPSLTEQEKIAAFFSLIDEKIENQRQKKQALEWYKKGILQKIFSQEIRFKDVDGEEYPQWLEYNLGKLGTFFKGATLAKANLSEEGTPCILYGELYTKYGEIIRNIISKTDLQSDSLVRGNKNDVLIPSSGETAIDIATASCLQQDDVLLGGDLNVFRSYEANGIFISYQLNYSKKKEIAKIAQGASVVHIYNEQLKKLKVDIPVLEEQEKIASLFSLIDQKINKEQEKFQSLNEWKKGLLQQMFI